MRPEHAYTQMLLDAMPRLDRPDRKQGRRDVVRSPEARTVLEVKDLKVSFPSQDEERPSRRGRCCVPSTASAFRCGQGETLGIVGESGCGKSTLARAVLQLVPHDGRRRRLARAAISARQTESEIRALRKDLQIVFQDPLASLDPRMTIGLSIAEPLRVATARAAARRSVAVRVRDDDGRGRARCPPGSTAIRTNSQADRTSASASRAP